MKLSGWVFVQQAWSPEFSPKYHQKNRVWGRETEGEREEDGKGGREDYMNSDLPHCYTLSSHIVAIHNSI
jgi:hypothetical protein